MLTYNYSDTPFGEIIAVELNGQICALEFTEPDGREQTLSALTSTLSRLYPTDELTSGGKSAKLAADTFASGDELSIPLLTRGTAFQQQIWDTLRTIPRGERVSYSQLAAMAGCPRAIRAAASAVARNPVSLIIPCHRVVRSDSSIGQYRWGSARKAAILEWEADKVKK